MVTLTSKPAEETFVKEEGTYQTKFLKWKGYVDRIPLLKSIVDIRAASVVASWRTKGKHDKSLADILDNMRGRGDETFKLIMSNMYKIAWVCGDAYAEIIFEGRKPVDLEVLPSDNITQIIEKGKIKRYEEIDGEGKWKPDEIFHLPYGKLGAMTHGIGVIPAMNNLLITYEQMFQNGNELFENFVKPREVIMTNTDNTTKNKTIADAFKAADKSFRGKIFLPAGLVQSYDIKVPTTGLDPSKWLKELRDEIFMATQTPEIILGTGYSTSEEDAKTRIAGFRGSVRFDQTWLEEHLRQQLFTQLHPNDTPDIKFSYATEAQDERYNRLRETATTLSGLSLPDNVKADLIGDLLKEMGLVKE